VHKDVQNIPGMAKSANNYNAVFGGYEWRSPPDIGGIRLMSVTKVAHRPIDPDYRCHTESWVLDYFCTPGFRLRVGSEKSPWFLREPFTIHLYPPGTDFWEDPGKRDRQLNSTWIQFDVPKAFGLRALVANPSGFAQFDDPTRRMDKLLLAVSALARAQGDEGYLDALPSFLEALNLLRRAVPVSSGVYQIPASPDSALKHSVIARVQEYFRTHLGESITVDTLASHVHMTPSALIRRYRMETGIPPMIALTRMRIDVAKSLLVQGVTHKAIADKLGFYDPFHFSKVFKKVEGIAPTTYLGKRINTRV
jgi:AraC-like DNA-binding protein